jgi:hypothetical protein
MKYTYDFELLEDGWTIHPISVGIVAEDGREYYAVNRHMDIWRIINHPWLMANVVPHLPMKQVAFSGLQFDEGHEEYSAVKHPKVIAREVLTFLTGDLQPGDRVAELWADYPAYDHVALCQLWGPMNNLPQGMPMRTNCLAQEEDMLMRRQHEIHPQHVADNVCKHFAASRPVQDPKTEHHALHDARFSMELARWLGVIKKREGVGS